MPQTKWWHWDEPTSATNKKVDWDQFTDTKSKIEVLRWAYRCHKQNGDIDMGIQVDNVIATYGMGLCVNI